MSLTRTNDVYALVDLSTLELCSFQLERTHWCVDVDVVPRLRLCGEEDSCTMGGGSGHDGDGDGAGAGGDDVGGDCEEDEEVEEVMASSSSPSYSSSSSM